MRLTSQGRYPPQSAGTRRRAVAARRCRAPATFPHRSMTRVGRRGDSAFIPGIGRSMLRTSAEHPAPHPFEDSFEGVLQDHRQGQAGGSGQSASPSRRQKHQVVAISTGERVAAINNRSLAPNGEQADTTSRVVQDIYGGGPSRRQRDRRIPRCTSRRDRARGDSAPPVGSGVVVNKVPQPLRPGAHSPRPGAGPVRD